MTIDTDHLLGTDLAGYRIESVLGRGGMGVVYLATDLRLKRRVALKLVAPELAADPRFHERFLREAELAASLDHSHIVPVYAAGELDGQLWIAMRYVQGTDLKTLLEQAGSLGPTRALALVRQVGEALDTAHVHGLVHRDVKPANVLVTQEGDNEHCYLADFGLARSPSEQQAATAAHLSGTVDYTAPEQIAAVPADQRADVYSLGCVLYECLAGEPPFMRPRPVATLFAHASEPPPSLHERRPELPEPIDQVVATALAKDPGERYETCGEFCRAAETALGLGRPRFTRRQIVLAGTGAALGVAAAAAIPSILLSSRGESPAGPPPILPVTEDSLVRIDPRTGEAIAATSTGRSPIGIAVGEAAVWVITTGDRRLFRLDPYTNEIVTSASLPPGESAQGIVAAEGAVWTIHAFSVQKYEPATDTFLPLPDDSIHPVDDSGVFETDFFTTDIAAGHGAIWVTTGDVLRLDPATGALVERITSSRDISQGPEVMWIAVGEGGVWTASQSGRVAFVDSRTNRVTRAEEVSDALDGITVGEGAVWAINALEDSILRIDPATARVTGSPVRVGRAPTAAAAGAGAVWVTSERDGTLTRIDPATSDIETIDVGGAATDVAVGRGAVWVTVDVP